MGCVAVPFAAATPASAGTPGYSLAAIGPGPPGLVLGARSRAPEGPGGDGDGVAQES